jgi:hypothetical protein
MRKYHILLPSRKLSWRYSNFQYLVHWHLTFKPGFPQDGCAIVWVNWLKERSIISIQMRDTSLVPRCLCQNYSLTITRLHASDLFSGEYVMQIPMWVLVWSISDWSQLIIWYIYRPHLFRLCTSQGPDACNVNSVKRFTCCTNTVHRPHKYSQHVQILERSQ